MMNDKNILFYDGDCSFCNRAVNFVLNHKKSNNNIYFSSLQSDFAQKELKKYKINVRLDTLYYLTKNKVYNKSSASILLAKKIKFPYQLLIVFYIIPKFIRDIVYDQIAKRRQKIGKPYCVVPKEEDKKWFL
jgi:predicted DCC family thiol-disulfide oxidoreductase YuxK